MFMERSHESLGIEKVKCPSTTGGKMFWCLANEWNQFALLNDKIKEDHAAFPAKNVGR